MKKPSARYQKLLQKRARKAFKRRQQKKAEEREENLAFQELVDSGMLKEFRKQLEAEMAAEEDEEFED